MAFHKKRLFVCEMVCPLGSVRRRQWMVQVFQTYTNVRKAKTNIVISSLSPGRNVFALNLSFFASAWGPTSCKKPGLCWWDGGAATHLVGMPGHVFAWTGDYTGDFGLAGSSHDHFISPFSRLWRCFCHQIVWEKNPMMVISDFQYIYHWVDIKSLHGEWNAEWVNGIYTIVSNIPRTSYSGICLNRNHKGQAKVVADARN